MRELAGEVEPPDASAAEAARERQSDLLKPQGSLGRLEEIGARLAGMAGAPPPVPENPAVVICAGDHGVLARGVSPWSRAVTAAMVENFCAGGAAVNAIARTVGARVSVLDVGVASYLDRHPLLRGAKVRFGTGDPIGTLAALGGLEHAALVGMILTGAVYGIPVLLDGIVSNSAALVARALAPDSIDYTIAGHLSAEPGARVALEKLGLEPLLDLNMRLGEGSGGLLAVPLVQAAARTLREMATMQEAGVA